MPVRRALPLLVAILGCAQTLGCEHDLLKNLPDAPAPADAPSPDAPGACVAPAGALPPGTHEVFLSTEGVMLVKLTPDDATMNGSGMITATTVTVPPFLDGVPGRETYIAQIVTHAMHILAPYSVDSVTARPTSGDYQMISLGGTSMAVTGTCNNCVTQVPFSCGVIARAIGMVYDVGYARPAASYAFSIANTIGLFNGLAPVTETGDCMCNSPSCAPPASAECTFTSHGTVTNAPSCNRPTQDEPAMLRDVFGCR